MAPAEPRGTARRDVAGSFGDAVAAATIGPAMADEGSSTLTRVLGVAAAAGLAICTFGAFGLALASTLYDRGVVGHRGTDRMESLTALWAGVIGGTAFGVVVAMWVGLRVWHGQWLLLILLAALCCVTAVTLVIAASA